MNGDRWSLPKRDFEHLLTVDTIESVPPPLPSSFRGEGKKGCDMQNYKKELKCDNCFVALPAFATQFELCSK